MTKRESMLYSGLFEAEKKSNFSAKFMLSLVFAVFLLCVAVTLFLVCTTEKAHAQTIPCPAYSVEQIASAIYLAEGGDKTSHPYGILAHYKHTTPRQACVNTIRHALRDWNKQGDFIVFLGNRYCPVGAKNDPTGLNKNWVRNVKHFLNKGGINA